MKNILIINLLLFLFTYPMIGKTQSLKVTQYAIASVKGGCNCTKSNTQSFINTLPTQQRVNNEVFINHSLGVFEQYGVFQRQVPIRNIPLRIIRYNSDFSTSIIKPLK